jgi:GT2 family glycosyltransferase/glycosyltransferase involved in cell wall biosynthesis
LFARYADRHLSATYPGYALSQAKDAQLGYVDIVTVHGNRIRFDGWTTADQILLRWNGGQVSQRPHIQREDVANALGIERETGFAVEAPLGAAPYQLILRYGNAETPCDLRCPSDGALSRRRALLWLRFLRDLMSTAPSVLRWLLTHDPIHRARVKSRLDLDAVPMAGPMDPSLFTLPDASEPDLRGCPITIVLPVYNAFDLLPEVLRRVEAHTDLPWTLIVIEDGSTDSRVLPFLKDWAGARAGRVTLLQNAENRGFIESANRGLAAAIEAGRHVVLLNSDAFVPEGWASRLLRPMLLHDNVASVTPMSNDAEIFSVPAICTRTPLMPGEGDAIDAIARRFNPEAALATAPTGVGFCMAMNIDILRQLPELDTIFGRGYGEEVDWCQKARGRGARHLGVPGLFVEHKGGESFGSEEKRTLVQRNNAVITRRYPDYDREVQQFIQADPMISARTALAIAFVAARHPNLSVPVYLAHSLGGGAENYLQDRVARDLKRGISSIILRVGGPQRIQLEVRTPDGETSGTTDDIAFLQRLLEPLPRKRILYSCGVGDPDPITLPDLLLSLCNPAAGDEIEVLIHDFFPVSPSYTLLDHDGVYRGPVTAERQDPAHRAKRPDGRRASIAEWQAAWGRLIAAAKRITVFSEDSRDQMLAAYPLCGPRVAVRPHDLLAQVPHLPAPDRPGTVIAVLGNIGRQKGAAVLQALAQSVARQPDMSLVLIGNIDPAYQLPPSVPVHGNYRLEDLPALAARYGVGCWLIPSIWPETFSYTTHECLATGLPVFAFDIGAQGQAVARAENGHPVHCDPEGNWAASILQAVRAHADQTAPDQRAVSGR